MAKASSFKKFAAVVIVSCICAALVSVPAYGYYYAHDEGHVNAESKGVSEVICTLDETAVGGGIHTGIVFLAEGATSEDALAESVINSLAANEPDAIKNHTAQPLSEYLNGKSYTVSVYEAASQKLGTHTTNDAQSIGNETVTLNRYDRVVVTVM